MICQIIIPLIHSFFCDPITFLGFIPLPVDIYMFSVANCLYEHNGERIAQCKARWISIGCSNSSEYGLRFNLNHHTVALIYCVPSSFAAATMMQSNSACPSSRSDRTDDPSGWNCSFKDKESCCPVYSLKEEPSPAANTSQTEEAESRHQTSPSSWTLSPAEKLEWETDPDWLINWCDESLSNPDGTFVEEAEKNEDVKTPTKKDATVPVDEAPKACGESEEYFVKSSCNKPRKVIVLTPDLDSF